MTWFACVALLEEHTPLVCCRCRQIIPPAAVIKQTLIALMSKKWVDEAGCSLVTDNTMKSHQAALQVVKDGRVSGKHPAPVMIILPGITKNV